MMIPSLKKNDRVIGSVILAVILAVLLIGMLALWTKMRHDLNDPMEYHLKAANPAESSDDFVYSVDISKNWKNDPDTPLQTYGAQYDHVITNKTDYDLVNWSLVIEVPEKNITIDSSWNGQWEYDKKASTIAFTPNEMIEVIKPGESGTFGAVLISKELMEFTDVNFKGCIYKPITKYWLFWVIMVLLIAWVTSTIAFVLYIRREENHRRESERLNNVIDQTMRTFANFIDAKDKDTKGHSSRVAYYSQKIAEKLGMSEDKIRDIGYIGLLHDCGKLSTPGGILNKPGKLTEEEFDIMRHHTENGGKILAEFTTIEGIKDGALYHHERYDGTGYMAGLAGEDIPLIARIICVADALDAMNSDRCYRRHLEREQILSELEKNKGTQFDPKLADIVIDMIRNGEIFVGSGPQE